MQFPIGVAPKCSLADVAEFVLGFLEAGADVCVDAPTSEHSLAVGAGMPGFITDVIYMCLPLLVLPIGSSLGSSFGSSFGSFGIFGGSILGQLLGCSFCILCIFGGSIIGDLLGSSLGGFLGFLVLLLLRLPLLLYHRHVCL